jgi:hypothetical protein
MTNPRLIDLKGQTFGNWTVLDLAPKHGSHTEWFCRCICGTVKPVHSIYLRKGLSTSCGCAMPKLVGAVNRKHGQSSSRLYWAYHGMKQRCENPNHVGYHLYGGRGIKVCERWKTFEMFATDMGERPAGKTLERKDNNGDYTPENCTWASLEQQRANRRVAITDRIITYQDRSMTARAWARELGINHVRILKRLDRGFSVEQAFFTKPWQRITGHRFQ